MDHGKTTVCFTMEAVAEVGEVGEGKQVGVAAELVDMDPNTRHSQPL